MAVLYKVQNNEYFKDTTPLIRSVICRISAKNVIAFCYTEESSEIFVCDIAAPWQHHKVCSSKSTVNVLEWNSAGNLLFVGYKGGSMEVWSPYNQVISAWHLQYRANLSAEDIINAKFFHSGKSVYFHSQRKDLPYYAEKFEFLNYRPTLTKVGNAALEGCIILTASGLICVIIIPKLWEHVENGHLQPLELNVSTHSIGLSRKYIATSCISYCPSGSLNVALKCYWQEQIIHCFKVTLRTDHEENVKINCESLPNAFLSPHSGKKISFMRWMTFNNENALFIAYGSDDGSLLEQWNLKKNHQGIHKLLQKNKMDLIDCEYWENVAAVHLPEQIADISISKLVTDSIQIFLVLKNHSVQILEPGLKKMGETVFHRLIDSRQSGCKFMAAETSFMNQILWVFDNYGQMYAMQIPNPQIDKTYKMNAITMQVSLLEYCIITGADASDVLMLNLVNLEMLIEKLTENFTRQPAFTRHFYYSNFLCLKSNICRFQSKQQDFDNLIILHSISITFKSLLRPSDLTCQDKGPAENLSLIISEPVADVDKVLFNLDAKDFTVEPLTLQSLQQLIQWVADMALSILNKLPDEIMKSKLCKKQGYDISRDVVAIGSIRELLVMIRVWGLLNSQCLPIYTKSIENIDVLAILFRLLTRLTQNTNEPDDLLLDECSVLSTQIVTPPKQFNYPTTLLNCNLSIMKSLPLFTVGVEPVGLQDVQIQEVLFANGGLKDGVSNMHLGSRAKPIRKCIRCGFVNSLQRTAKTPALKSWCNRWVHCHCGGLWNI